MTEDIFRYHVTDSETVETKGQNRNNKIHQHPSFPIHKIPTGYLVKKHESEVHKSL